MDFQICSDLHLDLNGGLRAPVSCYPIRRAPILLLCGDAYTFSIPAFPEMLRRVAEPFEAVLYVPGNHEHYGSRYNIDKDIEDACFSIGNVIFMNKRSIHINGMQYIGATLWTNNPTDRSGTEMMNDYDAIEGFTPKKSFATHKEHREFIISAVSQAKHDGMKGAIVMTHHAPDDRLAFEFESRPSELIPFYFASDMQEVTNDPFVKVWAHGHTHEAYRIQLNPGGTIFASNAHGYKGENTGYTQSAVFRI